MKVIVLNTADFEYRVRRIDRDNGIVAVDLVGAIFVSNIGDFGEIFDVLRAMKLRDVIFNFKDLDFISSIGIGQIIDMNNRLERNRVRLWVSDVCPEIATVFTQLSIQEIMRVLPTEKQVIEKINEIGPPV